MTDRENYDPLKVRIKYLVVGNKAYLEVILPSVSLSVYPHIYNEKIKNPIRNYMWYA